MTSLSRAIYVTKCAITDAQKAAREHWRRYSYTPTCENREVAVAAQTKLMLLERKLNNLEYRELIINEAKK